MSWDKNQPAGSNLIPDVDDNWRLNNDALEAALDLEHYFATGGDQSGKHKFPHGDTASRPAASVAGRIYLNTETHSVQMDTGAAWEDILPTNLVPYTGADDDVDLGAHTLTASDIITTGRSSFRVHNVSEISIPSHTATKIPFLNVDWDNLSEWNASTYRWTAKQSGIFLVNSKIQFNTTSWSTGSAIDILLDKNGTQFAVGNMVIAASYSNTADVGVTSLVKVNIGDYIDAYAWCTQDTSLYNDPPSQNYLSITKIGD